MTKTLKIIKKALWQNKVSIIQFIKFCLIGFGGVWIHISTTYLLTEYIGIYYLISYYIGQFLGMTNNFIWNKYLTFQKKDWKHIQQYILSMIFYSITALISGGIVYLLTEYLWIRYIISTIITIPIVSLVNFISHKYIVFRY